MSINCAATEPELDQITIDQCGQTLTGSTATITVNDPTVPAGVTRYYDLFINDVDQGLSQTSTTFNVTGLPTDGSIINKRIRISDDERATWIVAVECTCTAALIDNLKGSWPEHADTERVLGGVAYPYYLRSGVQVSNSIGAWDHAICFRAWKTGTANGFEIHNRTPSNTDLNNQGGTERWRSFMIGGTYRYGNGGIYEPAMHRCDENGDIGELMSKGSAYELWPADQPGNSVIINPYRGANWNLVAGEWYWLVLENLTPPPGLAPVSAAVAQSWGNNVGYTCLNGNQVPEEIPGCPNKFGAIGGRQHTRHLYKNGGTAWTEWTRESTWLQFHYTDGVEVGDMGVVFERNQDYGGTPTEYIHNVQGNRRVRQRLRFPYAATRFDKVEVYHGHDFNLPAPNGQPLRVEVKNSSGTVLATALIPPKPIVWTLSDGNDGLPNAARDGKGTDRQRRIHQIADLDQVVTLQQNQDYFLELSAAAGANFRIPSAMSLNIMIPHPTREWVREPEHYGEWSNDGGNSWTPHASPTNIYRKNLPILLFCEGTTFDADGVVTGPATVAPITSTARLTQQTYQVASDAEVEEHEKYSHLNDQNLMRDIQEALEEAG